MRAGFVFTTIVVALGLGIIAGLSESRLLMRVLALGFAPAVWAASRVVERLVGRDMWHFDAPYPYRWMSTADEGASTGLHAIEVPVDTRVHAEHTSALSLAA